jgi:hypothetical protein
MRRRAWRELADAKQDSRACVIEEGVPACGSGPIQDSRVTIGKYELSRVEVAVAERVTVWKPCKDSFDPFESHRGLATSHSGQRILNHVFY